MPDLGIVRGGITLLTFAAFLGVCWWAYRPSSRRRFQEDALLPFDDSDGMQAADIDAGNAKSRESA